MNKGELYGCVVGRAYELENEIAKGPRVVLGEQVIRYLESNSQLPGEGVNERYGREMASVCWEMIAQDEDGQYIVDYLGQGFKKYIANNIESSIYAEALTYVEEQIDRWSKQGDDKLTQRYLSLRGYFEKNKINWQE